jgi:membrane-associated phospholipid phosphatase
MNGSTTNDPIAGVGRIAGAGARARARGMGWLVVAAGVGLSGGARAEDDHRLEWKYPHFSPFEYATTGALIVNGAILELFSDQSAAPRWVGPVLFDTAVRDAVVGRNRATRDTADTLSDVAFYSAQLYSTVVDSGGVALIGDQNFEVASQTTLLNVQANALVFLLTRSSHRILARARSFHLSCPDDMDYSPYCDVPRYNASFISGHASMAFAGAGLTCAHHQYLPLYGAPAADVAACVGVTVLATASGFLRIVADKHYASDVVAGAILGGLVGYGLPVLFHYRRADDDPPPPGAPAPASPNQARTFGWSWSTPF